MDVTITDAAAFIEAAAAHEITELANIFTIDNNFDARWTLAGKNANADADTLTYSYYYKTVLAAGENTGALFTAVTIPANFKKAEMEALGNDFAITVTATAIQAETFETVEAAFAAYEA